MALGDTFDLGRAYTQAQGVKNMQSELSWRQQLMTDKKRTTEETAHLQEKYAMWRASDKDPALRAQILAEARQNGGPQLANVPDDALAQYIEAGFEQKLNLKKTDVGTLYATGEDGTYLPASQAVGKKKYEKPEKPTEPKHSNEFQLYLDEGGDENDKAAFAKWRRDNEDRKANAGKDGGGMSSADASLIYRQVVGIFGGTYDPITGTITGLDKDQTVRAQRLAAQASRKYVDSKGALTVAEAVDQAMNGSPGDTPTGGRGGARRPAAESPAKSEDKFVVGQRYKDAQGNVATYRGNGVWE
jgi:hypothetical protein